MRGAGCLDAPPRLPQAGPQQKCGVYRRQHQRDGVQRRLEVQATPHQRGNAGADQQSEKQGKADLVTAVPAAGPLQERNADAGAAVDEDGKSDRYNCTKDEKDPGTGHGALGALHAGEVLGTEQVIDAVDEINNGGNIVACLKAVPFRCGGRLRHGGMSIDSIRCGGGKNLDFDGRQHNSGMDGAQRGGPL